MNNSVGFGFIFNSIKTNSNPKNQKIKKQKPIKKYKKQNIKEPQNIDEKLFK